MSLPEKVKKLKFPQEKLLFQILKSLALHFPRLTLEWSAVKELISVHWQVIMGKHSTTVHIFQLYAEHALAIFQFQTPSHLPILKNSLNLWIKWKKTDALGAGPIRFMLPITIQSGAFPCLTTKLFLNF